MNVDEQLAQADQLRRLGKLGEAEAVCREVLRSSAGDPRALHLLGVVALESDQAGIAVAFIRKALAQKPDDPLFLQGLGNALLAGRSYQEAIKAYERVLEIDPRRAPAWNGMATALVAQGKLDEAAAAYRCAISLEPDKSYLYSNLMLSLQYSPTPSAARLLAEARHWADRYPVLDDAHSRWPDRDRAPERRLRVGYVSGDFWQHSVAYLVSPVLRAHDRASFEVYCYASAHRTDSVTESLRACSDCWRSLVGTTDDEAAGLIRRDEIDLLIDLSGHTAGNRLPVFARRPAPVQITWLGYSGTTGLKSMDYLIGDLHVTPVGAEPWYAESIIRMPDAYLCYEPLSMAADVTPLPCLARDYITFGSFNNVSKLTAQVAATWAAILARIPSSRLLLKAPAFSDRAVQARYLELFGAHGVAEERLQFIGHTGQAELMKLYGEVDVALDPFPYSGTVTSLETLWMGVPLVSLAGERFVARVGLTLLSALGLGDLVATSPQQYVERAVELVGDRKRLSRLRSELRSRMSSSSLLDGKRFTGHLETAYRDCWRRWCQRAAT